jgi:hypothetical protein
MTLACLNFLDPNLVQVLEGNVNVSSLLGGLPSEPVLGLCIATKEPLQEISASDARDAAIRISPVVAVAAVMVRLPRRRLWWQRSIVALTLQTSQVSQCAC